MKINIPTWYSPTDKIDLGNIKIDRYKHIEFPQLNAYVPVISGLIYYDSICIEFDDDKKEEINNFIAFHTFVANDHFCLNWYENIGSIPNNFKIIDECKRPMDYNTDMLKIMYVSETASSDITYNNLYSSYLALDEYDLGLIKNYLNILTFKTQSDNFLNRVTDKTFWKMIIAFSIIEFIIGKQENCECMDGIKCKNNSNMPITHCKTSAKKWIDQRLLEIIGNEDIKNEYKEVILEVRENIRHKTVHESLAPKSTYKPQQEKEVVYDLGLIKNSWDTDSTALLALESNIIEISRYLLLDKIFSTKIFPKLLTMHSLQINNIGINVSLSNSSQNILE